MTLAILPQSPPLAPDTDGLVRVGGTRVTLDAVWFEFQCGATAEEIVYSFPTLRLSDVYFAIGYGLDHPDELEAYLAQRQQQHDHARQLNGQRTPQAGIRERLMARRNRTSD